MGGGSMESQWKLFLNWKILEHIYKQRGRNIRRIRSAFPEKRMFLEFTCMVLILPHPKSREQDWRYNSGEEGEAIHHHSTPKREKMDFRMEISFWSIPGWALWLLISSHRNTHAWPGTKCLACRLPAVVFLFSQVNYYRNHGLTLWSHSILRSSTIQPHCTTLPCYITNYSGSKCDYACYVNVLKAPGNIYTNN